MRSVLMQTVTGDKAASAFQEIPKVIAAWAFGSAQGGQIAKGSDLDIAILVDPPLLFEELTDLVGALQDAFHFENIDLVPLTNNSSPILRFEAVSGRLLFCRDAAK